MILRRIATVAAAAVLGSAVAAGSAHADVGRATWYKPSYLPTACYGNSPSHLPSDAMFVAVGDGLWDNGAACGRHYMLRCISAAAPATCRGGTIDVVVVDHRNSNMTMTLSRTAWNALVRPHKANTVNVEFVQN